MYVVHAGIQISNQNDLIVRNYVFKTTFEYVIISIHIEM